MFVTPQQSRPKSDLQHRRTPARHCASYAAFLSVFALRHLLRQIKEQPSSGVHKAGYQMKGAFPP
jgi:hypothetical protein